MVVKTERGIKEMNIEEMKHIMKKILKELFEYTPLLLWFLVILYITYIYCN